MKLMFGPDALCFFSIEIVFKSKHVVGGQTPEIYRDIYRYIFLYQFISYLLPKPKVIYKYLINDILIKKYQEMVLAL